MASFSRPCSSSGACMRTSSMTAATSRPPVWAKGRPSLAVQVAYPGSLETRLHMDDEALTTHRRHAVSESGAAVPALTAVHKRRGSHVALQVNTDQLVPTAQELLSPRGWAPSRLALSATDTATPAPAEAFITQEPANASPQGFTMNSSGSAAMLMSPSGMSSSAATDAAGGPLGSLVQPVARRLQALQAQGSNLLMRTVSSAAQVVAGRAQADLRTTQDALAGMTAQAKTVRELEEKLQALQQQSDTLSAQLEEAQRRATFAEAKAAALQGRLDNGRALHSVDRAAQVFRRHVSGLPPGLDPGTFYEREEDVIGRGGCATVYAWQPLAEGDASTVAARVGTPSQEAAWAVKVDPISYRYARGEFEPERCADLLPAFLPPHRNILAPKAWWVGALPPQPAKASANGNGTGAPSEASGFRLYTLYERLSCSVWELMQRLRTGAEGGVSGAPTAPSGTVLLDLRSLLVVVRDVAGALAHLASQRVVHCDVKAENVMLVLSPAQPDGESGPQVERAVLIDFGLARLLPPGVDQLSARGGTWTYKAPESLSGPPGLELAGQARPEAPYVCQASDVWALGTLICMLCNNGQLPSYSGLPFALAPGEVLKWGDRPNGNGGVEPFYVKTDDLLPKAVAALPPTGASPQAAQAAQQRAHVMALLRRLATGCLQADPAQRLTAAQVRDAASDALAHLDE